MAFDYHDAFLENKILDFYFLGYCQAQGYRDMLKLSFSLSLVNCGFGLSVAHVLCILLD